MVVLEDRFADNGLAAAVTDYCAVGDKGARRFLLGDRVVFR